MDFEDKEAMFYEKGEDKLAQCKLCPHKCRIKEGGSGICKVRINKGGKLFTLVYGRPITRNLDPIEKKPLFHALPGSFSYSIATVGCNFQCSFCQNWEISQYVREYGDFVGREVSPSTVVEEALLSGASSISYTYTEPTIFYEYAYEIAKIAKEKGLKNFFVTNGFITKEAVIEMAKYLDGANIDLKAFKEETYRKIMKGSLQGVLEGIRAYKEAGVWIEITTLLVPGMNDSEEEIREIAKFISSLDRGIPWHISRFRPDYKMVDRGPTPLRLMRRAKDIGHEEGLSFIYLGNVPGDPSESTFCPKCGELIIERYGFYVRENKLKEGKCPSCDFEIPGIWN